MRRFSAGMHLATWQMHLAFIVLATAACTSPRDSNQLVADASTASFDGGVTMFDDTSIPGTDASHSDADASRHDAEAPNPDASQLPSGWTCPQDFYGMGDGCDCGCGAHDPDCPVQLTLSDCEFTHCPNNGDVDTDDPSVCAPPPPVPDGWTCAPSMYNDRECNCGCGVWDLDCSGQELRNCQETHGCPSGMAPSPADWTQCAAFEEAWTCDWMDYFDSECDCGCGTADPACPAATHFSDCASDGCERGEAPNPRDTTECIDDPPQHGWTCDATAFFDGSQCDCGCGALDLDCPMSHTASDCDVTHCGAGHELNPEDLTDCNRACAEAPEDSGRARCTNGGMFSVGALACTRNLSACDDGHRYRIECERGECTCFVDGRCTSVFDGSSCSFSGCGWFLIDAT